MEFLFLLLIYVPILFVLVCMFVDCKSWKYARYLNKNFDRLLFVRKAEMIPNMYYFTFGKVYDDIIRFDDKSIKLFNYTEEPKKEWNMYLHNAFFTYVDPISCYYFLKLRAKFDKRIATIS